MASPREGCTRAGGSHVPIAACEPPPNQPQATCLRSGLPVALKVYFLNKVPPNVRHMIKREVELHHGACTAAL